MNQLKVPKKTRINLLTFSFVASFTYVFILYEGTVKISEFDNFLVWSIAIASLIYYLSYLTVQLLAHSPTRHQKEIRRIPYTSRNGEYDIVFYEEEE